MEHGPDRIPREQPESEKLDLTTSCRPLRRNRPSTNSLVPAHKPPPLLVFHPAGPRRPPGPPPEEMSSAGGDGGYHPTPPPFPFSFHLMELTVASAQDLFANSRSMRTYAVAWIDPAHKLRTRLDPAGRTEPTWNDKFVFRVDDAVLRTGTAAVTINIYAARSRFLSTFDTLIGTARALLSTLRPSTVSRFVAVQVRRPQSLRPQGILNLGVSLLDAYVRSLPIFAELADAGAPSAIVCNNAPTNKNKQAPIDRHEAAVRSKLEQWRSELPPVSDEERTALEAKLAKWRAELKPLPEKERSVLEAKLAQWSSEMPLVPPVKAKSKKGQSELPPVPGQEQETDESKMVRSPALDKEQVVLEAKLALWRSELPPLPRRERAAAAGSNGPSELLPPPPGREGAAVREELPPVADGEEKEKSGGKRSIGGGEGELEARGDKAREVQRKPHSQLHPIPPPRVAKEMERESPSLYPRMLRVRPSLSLSRRVRKASPSPPPPPPPLPVDYS